MKTVGKKEILQAILQEALTIKRKKELYQEALNINKELKQLNEYGHPGAMLGHGFKDYEGPSPVMGMVTPSNYEEVNPGEECCLDEFPKLEKDIQGFGDEEGAMEDGMSSSVEAENEELKEKLAKVKEVLAMLDEGFFSNVKAGWQGLKTGVQTGVQAGKEAGQQQYQQTQQAQAIKAKKDAILSQLNQAKKNALNKGEVDWRGIQQILSQLGYKYIGGNNPTIQPLAEGEDCGMTEGLDEAWGGFLRGAANKLGGDISKGAQNVAGGISKGAQNVAGGISKGAQNVAGGISKGVQGIAGGVQGAAGKVSGAVQNAAGKVGQYASDIKAAGQQASAQQNQAAAEEQKSQEYIAAQYDKVINLLNQVK